MIYSIQIAPIVNKVFAVGEKIHLDLIVKADVSVSVTWSSEDSTVCSVNQNGDVTALKVGETRIKVLASNGMFDFANIVVVANEDYNTVLPEINENMAKGYIKEITAND